jgi:hypothetical protein
MLPFLADLLWRALLLSVSWMGTSVLAVSVNAVIVPAAILLIKLRHGWKSMTERVRKNLEDTLIASVVVWVLLILFNFVYTVPHEIIKQAAQVGPPPPLKLQKRQSTHITSST